jgi:hypothetical protein
MDWAEIRAWVQLASAAIGGALALLVFFQNLQQRRVENAIKFVAMFRTHISDNDIDFWRDLFRKASEPAGAKPGHYVDHDGMQHSISEYFSEGSPDNYAVSRLTESLDVACHQVVVGAADGRTVYYELGQLIRTLASWLDAAPSATKGRSVLDQSFPSIRKFERRYASKSMI